ncbi:hypothetical protein JZK55_09830 [Dissulfurispira thermophila]|uniref:Uncharacterized protein n=2 Tax=root TaxID=1 RepID=A0A7G1H1S8_9BACT|nr:ankyrin repeat domain-containing protein [Dissulfurispira thermophila]BCB96061.1 hypothetical protein JZK55_09830 [Dissulfurispira thermophila]
MKMKDSLISLISVIFILLVGMGVTGCAALNYAAYKGDVNAVKDMLDKGANVKEGDIGGRTPLMEAAWGGHLDVVKLLVERGADVNAVYNPGGVS